MRRRAVEKMVAIPLEEGSANGIALDGIWLDVSCEDGLRAPPRGGAVVAPPHPLYGGRMDNPVVTELALACERADLVSLRFDWRGTGGSGGEASGDPAAACQDYCAALRHVEATCDAPLVGCGYSFGAAAALRAAARHPRVRRLLLVAPPPALLDRAALAAFQGDVAILVGDADAIAPPAALEAITAARPRTRLERVAQADHFFASGLAELGRLAAGFLAQRRSDF
jgi:alpha/beta superfamily hydrolase